MTTLLLAVEAHNSVIDRELQEEVSQFFALPLHNLLVRLTMNIINFFNLQRERLAREYMIAEQNRAYEESLQADREKVRLCAVWCRRGVGGNIMGAWLVAGKEERRTAEGRRARKTKQGGMK